MNPLGRIGQGVGTPPYVPMSTQSNGGGGGFGSGAIADTHAMSYGKDDDLTYGMGPMTGYGYGHTRMDANAPASGLHRWWTHFIMRRGGIKNKLAHKLVDRYLDKTGGVYTLSEDEINQIDPQLRDYGPQETLYNEEIWKALNVDGSVYVTHTSKAYTHLNGTLGNFTVHFEGTWTKTDEGKYTFNGTRTIEDTYDFDNNPNNLRSGAGHRRTWYGRNFINGSPFDITSGPVPYTETWEP